MSTFTAPNLVTYTENLAVVSKLTQSSLIGPPPHCTNKRDRYILDGTSSLEELSLTQFHERLQAYSKHTNSVSWALGKTRT
jgi:hypothetical protein